MIYDITAERYSHLAKLTQDEISIVMFLADTVCDNIQKARDEKSNPDFFFRRTCTWSNTGALSTSDAKATKIKP